MRFRVALAAVLVFAVLDVAQGFDLLGGSSTVVVRDSAARIEPVGELGAATSPPVSTTAAPPPTTAAVPTTLPTTTLPIAPTSTTASVPPTTVMAIPPDPVVARVVASHLDVYRNPGDASPAVTLSAQTEFGNARTLLAVQERDGWVQVMLPVRPNGAVGWTKADAVHLSSVPDVIDVDVDAHTLTWGRRGDVVLSAKVATGAATSPTPRGTFYVTDVLGEDPNGALGAWVLALNGHSDTFTEFEGGDARIAIHGTNDASSIGRAASFGCVGVDASTLARLAAAIEPGTPVVIH
jgi:lipoprotein-anchoring transpeptidase ErfK/SrfK